ALAIEVARGGFVQPAFGRAARQDEAPVAIAAIDIALLVDLHPHARVAERGRAVVRPPADVAGAVAPDARRIDQGGFGDVVHAGSLSFAGRRPQSRSAARAQLKFTSTWNVPV